MDNHTGIYGDVQLLKIFLNLGFFVEVGLGENSPWCG